MTVPVTGGAVVDALARVRARIEAAGGDPARVRIVAVTKGFGADTVRAAEAAGLRDLGENYAQDLVAKVGAAPSARWHFLGPVQRNKVASLAPLVHLWHAVEREAAAEAIARRAPAALVLVQVNVSGEPHKPGCARHDAPSLVERCRDLGLDVRGLMGVGPGGAPESARAGFRWLAGAARRLDLAELSMGMSGDLEVAIQEGATIVRLGRALFGDRPRNPRGTAVGSLAGGD